MPAQEAAPNGNSCQGILAQLTPARAEMEELNALWVRRPDVDGLPQQSQEEVDRYEELHDLIDELVARLRAAAEQEFPLETPDGGLDWENHSAQVWLLDQIDYFLAPPRWEEWEPDPEKVRERDRLRALDLEREKNRARLRVVLAELRKLDAQVAKRKRAGLPEWESQDQANHFDKLEEETDALQEDPLAVAEERAQLAFLEFATRPENAAPAEVDRLVDNLLQANTELQAEQGLARHLKERLAEESWPESLPVLTPEPDPNTPPPVADLLGVLYSDKLNWLYGLPGCGKSWVALHGAVKLAEVGRRAVWIDAEDSERTFGERRKALSDSPQVRERIRWIDADVWKGLSDEERQGVVTWLMDGHVFVDAAGSTGAGETAESFAEWRKIFLIASGTTVIDHIPKRREDRPPGPIGSIQKLAAVTGAAIHMIGSKDMWTREAAGEAKLIVQKDRPGGIGPANSLAGIARGIPDNGRLKITVEEGEPGAAEVDHDADHDAIEAVKQFLRENPGASKSAIRKGIKGIGKGRLDGALQHLVNTAKVAIEWKGKTMLHYLHDDPEGGPGFDREVEPETDPESDPELPF